ncbi:MAG: hypothetical protein HGB11_03580 [Chlorobiales bacterium]|nr:hypothetical protein [Chlorobiales bacterium]
MRGLPVPNGGGMALVAGALGSTPLEIGAVAGDAVCERRIVSRLMKSGAVSAGQFGCMRGLPVPNSGGMALVTGALGSTPLEVGAMAGYAIC